MSETMTDHMLNILSPNAGPKRLTGVHHSRAFIYVALTLQFQGAPLFSFPKSRSNHVTQ